MGSWEGSDGFVVYRSIIASNCATLHTEGHVAVCPVLLVMVSLVGAPVIARTPAERGKD